MKKILILILSMSIMLLSVPCSFVYAANDFLITYTAEDILDTGYFETIDFDGEKVISFRGKNNSDYITPIYYNYTDISDGTEPTISIEFTAPKEGYYYVWMEICPVSYGSGNSMWAKFEGEDYQQKNFDFNEDDEGNFRWVKLHSSKVTDTNTQTFSILARKRNLYIRSIEITDNPFYHPNGNEKYYAEPEIKPVDNIHPRVLITSDNIQNIKSNLLSEENKAFYNLHTAALQTTFSTVPTSYNISFINQIKSNAFEYVINGDKEKGQKAIDSLLSYLDSIVFENSGDYVTSGELIYAAALTYDWCYDIISDDNKAKIINRVIGIAGAYTEVGWPPVNQSGWGGHGAENTVLRDLLAFGIATYDEQPLIYEIVGGRIEEEYKDIRQLYYEAHKSPFGSDYAIYRGKHDINAMLLYKVIGKNNIWETDNIHYYPYWYIYATRPDNYYLTDGDSRGNQYTSNSDKTNSIAYPAMILSFLYGDGYLKSLYKNEKTVISKEYLEGLIFNDVTLKESDVSDLNYSKYFAYPSGSYIARTGWDDNSVIVNMKVNELKLDDHNHLDAGGFQIYYKGNLATDSGYYQLKKNNDESSIFGSDHHVNYAKQTIAHNCMLILDPDEELSNFTFSASNSAKVNSGGQKVVSSADYPDTVDKLRDDPIFNTSKVLAHEHNENVKNPDFTYLKGDLKGAYSDKVSEYERSFMFLNLHDEKIPAVLIVFDHVVSSNKDFEKTYLLHGVNTPEINGTRTVLKRTETVQGYTYNGKLVNDTLLPKNATINKVGDSKDDFIVSGYASDGTTVSENFALTNGTYSSGLNEGGGIRTEIKPEEANEEDYFLNVMQVTDADNEEFLETELIESETHTGVKIADRIVMLGKTKERITDNTVFSFEGEGTYKISVSDLEAGKWYVYNNKNYIGEYEATVDGGTIYFEGKEGEYEILSEQRTYNLTVTCTGNGSTSLVGGTYYNNKINFSVTPDYGYIASVYLDDVDITPFGKEEYSLYIKENSKITIEFTKDTQNIYVYSPYTFYQYLNSYNGKNAFIAFSKLEGISEDNKIIDYGMLLSDTKDNMTLNSENVKKATVSETFGKELSDDTFAFGIIFYGSGLKNFTNYHIRPYVIYEKNGEEIIRYGEIRTKYITNYYPYNDYVITNCEVN